MSRLLITGASGFLGKSVLRYLNNNHNFKEIICTYNSHFTEVYNPAFKFLKCNLLNPRECTQLFIENRPTHLLHLAWYASPHLFWEARENLLWVNASSLIFEQFCANGGEVFIGAGSLAEYDWSSGILVEQSTPLNPSSLYGNSKLELHQKIKNIRDKLYINTRIIWPRIGFFYGDDEPCEKLISKLINSIRNAIPIRLASPGFSRPYAHVNYFGKIIMHFLTHKLYQDFIFNLSASDSYQLKDIVDFLKSLMCQPTQKIYYNTYPSFPEVLKVNTYCLRNASGFDIPDTFFNDLKEMIETKNAI